MQEASHINLSLSNLGNVINAIVEKKSFIPYRSSKLTFLLSQSIGGNSNTCIISTINTEHENEST
ncbi:MAG: hypothetical protein H8E55_50830 [Pelagibacterales bacterium]|nr:hypothetical protein [Pelagibacterales bacterium]